MLFKKQAAVYLTAKTLQFWLPSQNSLEKYCASQIQKKTPLLLTHHPSITSHWHPFRISQSNHRRTPLAHFIDSLATSRTSCYSHFNVRFPNVISNMGCTVFYASRNSPNGLTPIFQSPLRVASLGKNGNCVFFFGSFSQLERVWITY